MTAQSTDPTAPSSVGKTLAGAAEIAASRERVRSRLLGRERSVTVLLAAAFLGVAGLCAVTIPSTVAFSPWTVVLFVAVYAVVAQVEFEVGPGSAVPTELVLVPMLFALPLGLVPFCVAAGLVLGGVIERGRSRRHGQRLAVLLCSSWHCVGPVLVIALLAPGPLRWEALPAYVLAFGYQGAFDTGSLVVRHVVGRGVALSDLGPALAWVVAVDATLAPIAVVVAFAAAGQPLAILAVPPLVVLLYMLGSERRRRIDQSIVLGRAVEDATREARSDPLTGVGNRRAWQEALERHGARLADEEAPVSVVLVDLDELKVTNDRHGHDTGDRLIQSLAAVLRSALRESDELARIGGDEFAVLAFGVGEDACAEIVSRIRSHLATVAVGDVTLSASLGSASCPPCGSLDEALRLADARLYAEKLPQASSIMQVPDP